jgi:Zn-dependent metalloprotease
MLILLALSPLGCAPGPDLDPRSADAAMRRTDADAQASLEALRRASRVPVTLHADRGVPAAVYAQVPVAAGHPIDQAYAYLESFADLYALDTPRLQLHPHSVREDETGAHVRFVQRALPEHGGLPVFDAGVIVHLSGDEVFLTTGRYLPDLVPPAARLGSEEALALARIEPALRDLEVQGEARLGVYVVWGERTAPVAHTVWRMVVTGSVVDTGEPVFWRLDVDAVTGDLVHLGTLTTACDDKDFDIMYGKHGSSSSCWAFASTDDWFDADGTLSDYSATDDHNNDGMTAFANAHTVYDYYASTFGLCSYDDDDAEVEMVVHALVDQSVASSTGFCGTMQFTDGSAALDVVAHEFTHLVDYNHEDLEYEGQSGALDESFADVFGALIDGNWTFGEGTTGGAFRSLANPPMFGDPDHMTASLSGDGTGLRSTANPSKSNDWGNVHTNSGIPNKVAFLLTVGGTHNGRTIAALGPSRVEQLYHLVHTAGLDCDASFVDARHAMVGFANYWGVLGMHGFTQASACQVANAWASVGVAEAQGDLDCDGTADNWDGDLDGDGTPNQSDSCPGLAGPWQGDLDFDGIGDGCDDDIDGDTVLNQIDNCDWTKNLDQIDTDGDGIGDPCDDQDLDQTMDVDDNCPTVQNYHQFDQDEDGLGDACDPDIDGDGVPNRIDRCPVDADPGQADSDSDGVGDVCDNCPTTHNPDQADCDNDGEGTACESDLSEQLLCGIDWYEAEMHRWVHPLDELALPHVALVDVAVLPADYALQLTVVGSSDPWVVTDHFGNIVAHSEAGGELTRTATWTPALDYHYVEASGRADFATTYSLAMPPTGASAEVDLLLEGVTR